MGKEQEHEVEFGGWLGAFALIVWSHYILLYFWYCYETNDGKFICPTSWDELWYHLDLFSVTFAQHAIPSAYTWGTYFAFFFVQIVLAAYMPGLTMEGLLTETGRLKYHCNGYLSYYFCMFGTIFAQYVGIYDITYIAEHFGEFLIAAIIIGDVTSLWWYFYGIWFRSIHERDPTGNPIYDFFMGTVRYPRITCLPYSHPIDIKMIAECRWSWTTLMLLTASCAMVQYKQVGYVSKEMGVMLFAHWLYSNATAKGEHCIPGTWDMFNENFGWMLNFWNIAGVPFLYCYQSFYILKNHAKLSEQLSIYFIIFVYLLLLLAYYVFDSANCQKASYKLGDQIKRATFPQVPWGVLPQNCRCIPTPKGRLLADGWYAHVRKIQYTGDIVMALCWGLACGFESPLPYFYCAFFTGMIIHRQTRDEVYCKGKYGEYWDMYVREVPNVFLPSWSFFKWLWGGAKPLPAIYMPPDLAEEVRLAQLKLASAVKRFDDKLNAAEILASVPAVDSSSENDNVASATDNTIVEAKADSEPAETNTSSTPVKARARKATTASTTKARRESKVEVDPEVVAELRAETPTRGRTARTRGARAASPSPARAKKVK